MAEHFWSARLSWVGPNFMADAETEGGGAIYVQGRVRSSGHSSVPSCVAAPAAGRADRCGNSPTSIDGGQPASHHPCEESGSPRPEQARVDGGQIIIEFVETGRQLTDVLTKTLGRLRLTELKEMIGMEGV